MAGTSLPPLPPLSPLPPLAALPPLPPLPAQPAGDPKLKASFEKHLGAVKWVIGLPVAVLFGTSQFVDKIDFAKHPYASSLLWWIVVVNAGAAVLSVWYYFVAIHKADLKLQGKDVSLTVTIVDAICFWGGFALFAAGFVLTVLGLVNYPAVQAEKTPSPTAQVLSAAHYRISVSGPVRDRRGAHFHTFLVNDGTGAVWRMECSKLSGISFVRVPVEGLPSVHLNDLPK